MTFQIEILIFQKISKYYHDHIRDELVGLSRAFIYAGTPSILSSLWMVEDESTAYLMTQFYKNLKKYDKAESLRKAQLKTKKKFDNLHSWASFVLIGDSK